MIELSELGVKIQNGWPSRRDEVNDELKQYWLYRDELSIIDGVILKSVGYKKVSSEMLKQLHIPHKVRKDKTQGKRVNVSTRCK